MTGCGLCVGASTVQEAVPWNYEHSRKALGSKGKKRYWEAEEINYRLQEPWAPPGGKAATDEA